MLELSKVKFFYKKDDSFQLHLNFYLPDYGFVLVKGKSGSGKTTLINLIAGLDSPKEGNIIFDNRILDHSFLDTYRKYYCSIVFQELNLIKGLTIKENLVLGFEASGFQYNEPEAKEYFNKLNLSFDELINRYPSELSGGERQRVAIIRALVKKPKILILDEPTSALDYDNATDVFQFLKELSKDILVVIASHDLMRLEKYSDIEICLSGGEAFVSKHILDFLQIDENLNMSRNRTLSTKCLYSFTLSHIKKDKTRLTGMGITKVLLTIFIIFITSLLFFDKNKVLLSGQDYTNCDFFKVSIVNENIGQSIEYQRFDDDLENRLKEDGFYRCSKLKNTTISPRLLSNELNFRQSKMFYVDNSDAFAVELHKDIPFAFDESVNVEIQHNPLTYDEIAITSSIANFLVKYSGKIIDHSLTSYEKQYKDYNDLLMNGYCYGMKICAIYKTPNENKLDFIENNCSQTDPRLWGFTIDQCVFVKDGYREHLLSEHDAVLLSDLDYTESRYMIGRCKSSSKETSKLLSKYESREGHNRRYLKVSNLYSNYLNFVDVFKYNQTIRTIFLILVVVLFFVTNLISFTVFGSSVRTSENDWGILRCIGCNKKEIFRFLSVQWLAILLTESIFFLCLYLPTLLIVNSMICESIISFNLFHWSFLVCYSTTVLTSFFSSLAGGRKSFTFKPVSIVSSYYN